jgi:hypothetical protein
MENASCPICERQLDTGTRTPGAGESSGLLLGEKLYCPSCEMLVELVVSSGPRLTANASDNPGRIRSGGSNAGGSQRGDLSDQGASQWRKDPKDGERNTWKDKD